MPYKIEGTSVFVQRGGRWQLLKHYTGPNARARALAYFRALQVNVGDHQEKKKRR
jgi:hypothetical protein